MSTKLLDKIFDLIRAHPAQDPAQQEREALLDLLVWTMFVDRHVADAERGYLRRRAAALPWDSPRPAEVYMDGSVRRVRDTLGSDNAEAAYLDDIKTRLGDEGSQKRALKACQELAGADGELAPAEQAHLDRLRKHLG